MTPGGFYSRHPRDDALIDLAHELLFECGILLGAHRRDLIQKRVRGLCMFLAGVHILDHLAPLGVAFKTGHGGVDLCRFRGRADGSGWVVVNV